MDNRRELVESYAEFLMAFDWEWFGTMTFRGYSGSSKAKRLFEKWINELQEKAGGPEFRWFRVTEKGQSGTNNHFHVLIGGLEPKNQRARWARRWEVIAGPARIEPYDPDQDGIYYMLKTLKVGHDFDFETNLNASLIQKWWTGDW